MASISRWLPGESVLEPGHILNFAHAQLLLGQRLAPRSKDLEVGRTASRRSGHPAPLSVQPASARRRLRVRPNGGASPQARLHLTQPGHNDIVVFMIPGFESNGTLPPGVHEATWAEFAARFGTNRLRRRLLAGLERAIASLASAGCQRVFVDGSFVTDREHPNDFDACWDARGVNPALLDPVLLDLRAPRAAQKAKYGGDIFPAANPGGRGLTILEFFQWDRNGERKGIVSIRPRRTGVAQGGS